MKNKKTLVEKLTTAGIWLLTSIIVLAGLGFISEIYNKAMLDAEPNSIVRNQVTIPDGATDLKEVGPDWYTFNYKKRTFVYHKKISYMSGTSQESIAAIHTDTDNDLPQTLNVKTQE